jgi:hypothetical protein
MANSQFIAPFPADIDRDAFGHWMSGFVDGEGCFLLYFHRRKIDRRDYPRARFAIQLRFDDEPILGMIQSFLGCGAIHYNHSKSKLTRNIKAYISVDDIVLLHNVVVKHFDDYPLRAKKRSDFLIWKEAVKLLYHVSCRPTARRRGKGCGAGSLPKWRTDEIATLQTLVEELKAVRLPGSSPVPAPAPEPKQLNSGPSQAEFPF